MASSDTLSIFVPDIGSTITQTTTSGAKVTTTLDKNGVLNTRVFSNRGRTIEDVNLKEPNSGDTRTTFSGASKNITYTGNDSSNTVDLLGDTKKALINTGKGDDSLRANDIANSRILLGDGNDEAVTGSLKKADIISGSGNDKIDIRGKADSARVDIGEGNDYLYIEEKVNDSYIQLGGGDDTLVFGGKVNDSIIQLGDGADEATFSAKVQDTWFDMKDGETDRLYFNTKEDFLGLGNEIISADGDGYMGTGVDDLLIIGGDEYAYDSSTSAFISKDGDSITFG